jgi:hypothetical protein
MLHSGHQGRRLERHFKNDLGNETGAEEDEANNMKLNPTIKQKDLIWSKIVGTLRRDKEGRKNPRRKGHFAIDDPTFLVGNYRTKWLLNFNNIVINTLRLLVSYVIFNNNIQLYTLIKY